MLEGLHGDCGCNGGSGSGSDSGAGADGRITLIQNFAPQDNSRRYDGSARFDVNASRTQPQSIVYNPQTGQMEPAHGVIMPNVPQIDEHPTDIYQEPVKHVIETFGKPWPRYAEFV